MSELRKLVEEWRENVKHQRCGCSECHAILICADELESLLSAPEAAPSAAEPNHEVIASETLGRVYKRLAEPPAAYGRSKSMDKRLKAQGMPEPPAGEDWARMAQQFLDSDALPLLEGYGDKELNALTELLRSVGEGKR